MQEKPDSNSKAESSAQPDKDSSALRDGSTAKYRDRPTDDGMQGDGADEPNEGFPEPRRKPVGSNLDKKEEQP